MGVPADHLSQPGEKRVYGPIGTSGLTVDQQEADLEPFFFYFDDESNDPQTVLLPADRLTAEHLDANHDRGPDTKVTFTKKRVRFGETDRKVYEKYASCGLYLETQQHPDAPSNNYGQMAWSLLSAVLPAVPLPTPKQTKGGSGGKNAAQDSSKVPAASTTASVAQADPSPKGATPLSSSVPPPTQTVLLPSGIGQSAFA
jgi:hypothetical protein